MEDGKIIATGAVIFYVYPPSYSNKTGMSAYITNMFTEPAYRGQGIATKILDMLDVHKRQDSKDGGENKDHYCDRQW